MSENSSCVFHQLLLVPDRPRFRFQMMCAC
uniref:Uncharacterized protein n=1 Tax=Arundo donax TaxID=35708 RepID=A0A0A8Y1Q5_ARUDO